MTFKLSMPLNISTDFMVEGAVHPAPLPPIPNAAVAGTFQHHPPGVVLHTAKLTRTVRHRTHSIVQQRHDCGPMIPHLTLPMVANPWLLVIIPGSSSKVHMGASTLKVNGKAAGMTNCTIPMLTCAFPAPVPTAFSVLTFTNTVKAGLLPVDLLAGAAAMVFNMAVSAALKNIFPSSAPLPGGAATEALLREGLKKMLPGVFNPPKWLAKQGLNAAAKLVVSTLEGNPTFQLKGGKAMARFKVKVKRTAEGWKPSLELNMGGGRLKDGAVSVFGQEL